MKISVLLLTKLQHRNISRQPLPFINRHITRYSQRMNRNLQLSPPRHQSANLRYGIMLRRLSLEPQFQHSELRKRWNALGQFVSWRATETFEPVGFVDVEPEREVCNVAERVV